MGYAIESGSKSRLLILPALFEEANRMRRYTVDVMRALSHSGIDTFLPDLPGCNESQVPLETQNLTSWRGAANAAAQSFGATHVLTIRGGALLASADLPCIQYAPVTGARMLRGMMRARTIQAREALREENFVQLQEVARSDGVVLSGWGLGAEMFRQLEDAAPDTANCTLIEQAELGGAGLWLRAEPGVDAEQSARLANLVVKALHA